VYAWDNLYAIRWEASHPDYGLKLLSRTFEKNSCTWVLALDSWTSLSAKAIVWDCLTHVSDDIVYVHVLDNIRVLEFFALDDEGGTVCFTNSLPPIHSCRLSPVLCRYQKWHLTHSGYQAVLSSHNRCSQKIKEPVLIYNRHLKEKLKWRYGRETSGSLAVLSFMGNRRFSDLNTF
jgi:hypothetical protein